MGICSSQQNKGEQTHEHKLKLGLQIPETQNNSPKILANNDEFINSAAKLNKTKRAGSVQQNLVIMSQPLTKFFTVMPRKARHSIEKPPFQHEVQNKVTGILKCLYIFNKQDHSTNNIVQGLRKNPIIHPNIVHLYELYEDESSYQLLTESCKGGSLLEFTQKNQYTQLPCVKSIIQQLINSVQYLHQQDLIHGHLSLKTFYFLDEEYQTIKLMDFQNLFIKHNKINSHYIPYLSPEQLETEQKTKQRDVWALGIIIYHLLVKKFPLKSYMNLNSVDKIYKGDFVQLLELDQFDQNLKKILLNMLQPEEKKRHSLLQILNNPYFQDQQLLINSIENLHKIRTHNLSTLQQCILTFMINQYCGKQKQEISDSFNAQDIDKNGKISRQDIRSFYQQIYHDPLEVDKNAEELIEKLDLDEDEEIEFSDYLMCVIDRSSLLVEDKLEQTFKYLSNFKRKLGINELIVRFKNISIQELDREIMVLTDNKDKMLQIHHFKNLMLQFKFFFSTTYDVAIIGGGSGGLAFAFEAQKLGLNTVIFDYVIPSHQGAKWGLGGTCVNVGCIPKKLMHQSALLKEYADGATPYGWKFQSDPIVDWKILKDRVQNHIKGLNFGYKGNIKSMGGTYINSMATFLDPNTLAYGTHEEIYTQDHQKLKQVKFKYCVVCVGGRPTLLQQIQNVAITSDDLFSLEKAPGKTLVVGGGYIALECAGLLKGLGFDVSMMTRGLYLREFDQGIAEQLLHFMSNHHKVKVTPTSLPVEGIKQSEYSILVKWKNQVDQTEAQDEFNTVLMAVGRTANTKSLNLDRIGVKVNPKNKKILGGYGEVEKTSVPNIYALGDVLNGVPELTPVAAKSGQFLARRIKFLLDRNYNIDDYNHTMLEYNDYPTTVFTPIEYSCVGLSEEQASQMFGEENIEVYHSKFTPLEEELCDKLNDDYELMQKKVYCKVVCNKLKHEQVVGFHYLGPNAGEVMQGFAVAIKLGLKFKDLQRTVGIHPTAAEEFVSLKVSKASNEDFEKHGC